MLYSVVFLFAIFAFYGVQDPRTGALVVFWGLFLALWPLGVPEMLSAFQIRKGGPSSIGRAIRFDSPNLVRVELDPAQTWTAEHSDPSGCRRKATDCGAALFAASRRAPPCDRPLCASIQSSGRETYTRPPLRAGVGGSGFGGREARREKYLGFDRFHHRGFVNRPHPIRDVAPRSVLRRLARLVPGGWQARVFQITEGATREEALEGDPHGFQYGVASQLGELESDAGFVRNHWVPLMNTPVFWDADIAEGPSVQKGDFVYGTLPGTKVPIAGPFLEAMDHHRHSRRDGHREDGTRPDSTHRR